jgi:hypothetical protein
MNSKNTFFPCERETRAMKSLQEQKEQRKQSERNSLKFEEEISFT